MNLLTALTLLVTAALVTAQNNDERCGENVGCANYCVDGRTYVVCASGNSCFLGCQLTTSNPNVPVVRCNDFNGAAQLCSEVRAARLAPGMTEARARVRVGEVARYQSLCTGQTGPRFEEIVGDIPSTNGEEICA
ncbi:hypothetical protein BJY01DRAFT_252628 [Aspergillus pseudoustus]|uniref:Uncharacterized protein n=1 Tax=Aspergillus pseudoustus TaxID=1810923 RepID=A0ABR4J5X1_9EURO